MDAEVMSVMWDVLPGAWASSSSSSSSTTSAARPAGPRTSRALREYYAVAHRPGAATTAGAGSSATRCACSTARSRRCQPADRRRAAQRRLPLRRVRRALRASCSAIWRRSSRPYVLNHRLVRGLDYYTKTVFEVWAEGIGAQSAICGGGRYDGLAEQLGGAPHAGHRRGRRVWSVWCCSCTIKASRCPSRRSRSLTSSTWATPPRSRRCA